MTNWVTTGADSAGRPWTLVDYCGSSVLLLTQLNDGRWFRHTEGVQWLHVGPDGQRVQPVVSHATTSQWMLPVAPQSCRLHSVESSSCRVTVPKQEGAGSTPCGNRATGAFLSD
ncbi:hypothetical protein B0E53_00441 [Micromonospora sp. MH33]|nr:hypothetical protein B0E53_00441 [Micromonospora sp. MH33]